LEEIQRERGPTLGAVLLEFLGRHAPVEGAREGLGLCLAGGRGALAQRGEHGVEAGRGGLAGGKLAGSGARGLARRGGVAGGFACSRHERGSPDARRPAQSARATWSGVNDPVKRARRAAAGRERPLFQRSPVSCRAMTSRWISLVPS